MRDGIDGATARLAAAQDLKHRLELILEGEPPYDIFVRWKPLTEQPIGWNPDLNDGVRLNIRPFMTAEVLRHNKKPKLNITWDKDRGKDVESAPWFKAFKGDRINDHHLTLAEKQRAKEHPMTALTLTVPDSALSALRRSPTEFAHEMKLAAAIHWYRARRDVPGTGRRTGRGEPARLHPRARPRGGRRVRPGRRQPRSGTGDGRWSSMNPPDARLVVNTSPLIHLAEANLLDLLRAPRRSSGFQSRLRGRSAPL